MRRGFWAERWQYSFTVVFFVCLLVVHLFVWLRVFGLVGVAANRGFQSWPVPRPAGGPGPGSIRSLCRVPHGECHPLQVRCQRGRQPSSAAPALLVPHGPPVRTDHDQLQARRRQVLQLWQDLRAKFARAERPTTLTLSFVRRLTDAWAGKWLRSTRFIICSLHPQRKGH